MSTLSTTVGAFLENLPNEEIKYNTAAGVPLPSPSDEEFNNLLKQCESGTEEVRQRSFDALFPKLLQIAAVKVRKERPGGTLTARDVVHEAYVRLAEQREPQKDAEHVYAAFSTMMRWVLVDRARRRAARIHGGNYRRVTMDPNLPAPAKQAEVVIAIQECLEQLERESPRQARIVELRFFGGLTNEEIAKELNVSVWTVENDWRFARAWLRVRLERAA